MSSADKYRQVVADLRAQGVTVQEMANAYGRNNGLDWANGDPIGPLNHHFVCSLNPAQSYIDGLVGMLRDGYGETPGPVVNWFVDVHGVGYLISTGPANHSGRGDSSVRDRVMNDQPPLGPAARFANNNDYTGNAWYTGRETQHPGDDTPYPQPLIDTVVAICAAESKAFGWSANRTIHHYEHTNRKTDMSWRGGVNGDGGPEMRRLVAVHMAGGTTTTDPANPDWMDALMADPQAQTEFKKDIIDAVLLALAVDPASVEHSLAIAKNRIQHGQHSDGSKASK